MVPRVRRRVVGDPFVDFVEPLFVLVLVVLFGFRR
jgi:hypothetical protein